MNCENVRELVTGYVAGELPERDSAEIEAHAAQCAACRELIDAERSAFSLTAKVFESARAEKPVLTAERINALNNELAQASEFTARLERSRSKRIFMRCAALFVIVAAATIAASAVYLADNKEKTLGQASFCDGAFPTSKCIAATNKLKEMLGTKECVARDQQDSADSEEMEVSPDSTANNDLVIPDESKKAVIVDSYMELSTSPTLAKDESKPQFIGSNKESKKSTPMLLKKRECESAIQHKPFEPENIKFKRELVEREKQANASRADLQEKKIETAKENVPHSRIDNDIIYRNSNVANAEMKIESGIFPANQLGIRSAEIKNNVVNDLSYIMRTDKLELNQDANAPTGNALYSYKATAVKSPFKPNTYVVYAQAVPNEKKTGFDQVRLNIDGNSNVVRFNALRQSSVTYAESLLFELPSQPKKNELLANVTVEIGDRTPLSSYKVTGADIIDDFSKAPAPLRLAAVAHAAVDPELVLNATTRAKIMAELEKLLENEYADNINVLRLKIILEKFK